MKRIPSWTWSAAAPIAALAAGVLIGRASSGNGAEDAARQDDLIRETPTRSGASGLVSSAQADRDNGESGDQSPEARRLQLGGILESSSRLERTQRLLAFLDRLPTDQFADVYAAMAESPMADIRGSERSLILQAWAERDPYAAVAYIQENDGRDWERETALSTWATIDPQGAYAWASTAEDDGRVNNWVLGTMRGIAATNPELARDFLLQMEDDRTRNRSLGSVQPYVMQFGSAYAEDWIANISDPELQNRASRSFADDMAELDPVRAAEWNTSIADTNTRRDVSEEVADRWARQDLDSARQWVESLPEDTRTEAAEGVARQYARQDPAAAASWLSGLGDNPDYDGARQVLIREAFRNDPVTSLDFVATISDEGTRNRNYHRFLRDWMRRDADSARSWAQSNQDSLPSNLVERIMR